MHTTMQTNFRLKIDQAKLPQFRGLILEVRIGGGPLTDVGPRNTIETRLRHQSLEIWRTTESFL